MAQQRKPLITHIFTADPSAHVFDDKLYIYPSHDIPHDGEAEILNLMVEKVKLKACK